ncbi:thioredoxin family protein [Pontibacter sp. MBLB2868]|uniref:thioredoxin family protein n=1 Tax=Pontibacter sp. MBLB2868 TaxID=3451555 RepID=UPI003F754106
MDTLATQTPQMVHPLSYDDFRLLVAELVADNRTTGNEQTAQKIGFTKLNMQRMKRVEKQFSLLAGLGELLNLHQPAWEWQVLVEAWCGDGAQVLPAIAGVVAEVPSIHLTVLLRDENPELMDSCLSNGSRSIPKLICLNKETGERLFVWGPRPTYIQQQVLQFKAEHPEADHDTLMQQVQLWYAKDRSQALQQDLLVLAEEVLATAAAGAEAVF